MNPGRPFRQFLRWSTGRAPQNLLTVRCLGRRTVSFDAQRTILKAGRPVGHAREYVVPGVSASRQGCFPAPPLGATIPFEDQYFAESRRTGSRRRGGQPAMGTSRRRPPPTALRLSPASSSGRGEPLILTLWTTTKEVDVHPEPHPEPGRELDCAVRAPAGGVIRTSWKTPPSGFERTTNAGELLRVPAAQLG
jgi:hypothetical protein